MSSRPREPRTSRTRRATRAPPHGGSRDCGIRNQLRAGPRERGRPSNQGFADAGYRPRAPTTDKLDDELDIERARVLARDLTRGRRRGCNHFISRMRPLLVSQSYTCSGLTRCFGIDRRDYHLRGSRFRKPILLGRGVDVPILVNFVGANRWLSQLGVIGLFLSAVVLPLGSKLFLAWLKQGETLSSS